jgi:ABC-type cobalamin/Fe3+-siderophores transport system ATPase subunit
MKANIPIENRKSEEFDLRPGTSVVFVGANGAGKTRLGIFLERTIGPERDVHRIAAHRSLSFNDAIEVISYERAEKMLRYGTDQGTPSHKEGFRWGSKPATILLSDFDHVLRALYAEQNEVAVDHLKKHRANPSERPPSTKLLQLKEIWERLLPHRTLIVQTASVKVRVPGRTDDYNASSLSDGERVIFYLVGQALLAKPSSVLIVDEPELHIHRSILADLWDQIEGARKDLTFIYTTHDLEFATTRHAEQKYALTSYTAAVGSEPEFWTLVKVEEAKGLPEQIVARILGSRRGILFVEGEAESLDSVIYRQVYPSRAVIPTGGHDQVIHSVASFRAHPQLHRLGCFGIIDCDDHSEDEQAQLAGSDVFVIPVSEVENLLLLPVVFYSIARTLNYSRQQARDKTRDVSALILNHARQNIERFGVDFARRRVDRAMKSVGLAAKDVASLEAEFKNAVESVNVQAIIAGAKIKLDERINAHNVYSVLRLYDNKGLLAEAAKHLDHNKKGLEEYVGRLLASRSGRIALHVLRHVLPKLPASEQGQEAQDSAAS